MEVIYECVCMRVCIHDVYGFCSFNIHLSAYRGKSYQPLPSGTYSLRFYHCIQSTVNWKVVFYLITSDLGNNKWDSIYRFHAEMTAGHTDSCVNTTIKKKQLAQYILLYELCFVKYCKEKLWKHRSVLSQVVVITLLYPVK